MKIAIGMKSNFAYERLRTALKKAKYSQEIELQPENVQDLGLLDDIADFWKPDLLILDSKLPTFDDLDILASQKEIEVIYFNSDFEAILEHVGSFFDLEEKEEESIIKEFNYVKKEVEKEVVIKDRIVEKEVIKTAYTSIPNKLIIVASLWQGAGSTTLGTNLARALSIRGMSVSYVEFPDSKPYLFDYLAIPESEEKRDLEYVDSARLISRGKTVRRNEGWKDFDIDWYVNDSRYEPIENFNYEDMLKFVYSINSTITIVDVSANLNNPNVQKFLHHADDIYVCVEPDPIKVDWLATITQNGKETNKQREEKKAIDYLNNIEEKEGISFQFVNMKYTKIIDNQSFWKGLGKKPIAFFPVVDYEVLIKLVWDSKFLYDVDDYREVIEKSLKPLIVQTVPRQYYELTKRKDKGIKNLLNQVFKKGEKQ